MKPVAWAGTEQYINQGLEKVESKAGGDRKEDVDVHTWTDGVDILL